MKQVIGRAWRLGQVKQVKVYHLVALQTTDVVMSSFARLKSEMLDAFVSSDENHSMCLIPCHYYAIVLISQELIAALRGEFEDVEDEIEAEDRSRGAAPTEEEEARAPPSKGVSSDGGGNARSDNMSTDVDGPSSNGSRSSLVGDNDGEHNIPYIALHS